MNGVGWHLWTGWGNICERKWHLWTGWGEICEQTWHFWTGLGEIWEQKWHFLLNLTFVNIARISDGARESLRPIRSWIERGLSHKMMAFQKICKHNSPLLNIIVLSVLGDGDGKNGEITIGWVRSWCLVITVLIMSSRKDSWWWMSITVDVNRVRRTEYLQWQKSNVSTAFSFSVTRMLRYDYNIFCLQCKP